jgi:hypothetical protein
MDNSNIMYFAVFQDNDIVLILQYSRAYPAYTLYDNIGSVNSARHINMSSFDLWMTEGNRTLVKSKTARRTALSKAEAETLSEICDIPIVPLMEFSDWYELHEEC